MKTFIWLNVLFLANVHGASEKVDPTVLISQGLVKGIKASEGGFSKFLGIPYAKVDLSEPFGAAREAPKFEEEFNANDNSRKCPQTRLGNIGISGSDDESPDCLQLSIYVPDNATTHNPLPVLVWIHGGVFRAGSGTEFASPNIVKQGIIVVTVNYRLGPYGFMCLDDPTVPGNQGLKDVYESLRWVRSNIAAFGGDPHNVTLAGQSAGSAIVLLQLYSSKEKLFDKVIAESGTPLSPDMFVKGDPDVAVKLAHHLGLKATNNKEALEFLAQTDHSLVTGASYDLKIDFKPCTEKSFSGVENFVDRDPYALSNEKKIKNTPILIGNTDQEYLSDGTTRMHGDDFLTKDFFKTRLIEKFNLENDQLEKVAQTLRHFYIGDKPISEDVAKEAAYFLSDFVFNHPIQDTITSLVRNNANPVYEYVFTYVGDSGAEGASHGAELKYLFNMSGPMSRHRKHSKVDPLMVTKMTTLWANFIKYGNPTPETSELIPIIWNPVTETTRPYLNIGSDFRMEARFLQERNAFWELFQSAYGKYSNLVVSTKTTTSANI